MEKACKNCKYCYKIEAPATLAFGPKISYLCRRNPPTILDGSNQGKFPEVQEDYWCGEFATKKQVL